MDISYKSILFKIFLKLWKAAKGGQEKNSRKKSESASEPVPQKKVKTTPVELLSDKEKLEVLKALEDDTEVQCYIILERNLTRSNVH